MPLPIQCVGDFACSCWWHFASEAQAADKAAQFEVLREFLLEASDADDYARVAQQLGWRRNTLAVAIHRLRQRLRELVRDTLGETVADASTLDAEMARMHAALAHGHR